jgi:RNA polymerase sigma-70 factor (ECF subfamily)
VERVVWKESCELRNLFRVYAINDQVTDGQLITRAAGGDRTAFELLYERHWKSVYSYAWLLTRSVADAEDVTQECFLALIRKPAAFDPARAELRTWLIAIVRRQWLGRCRNAARESGSADLSDVPVAAGFDERLMRLERAEAVRQALAALPPLQQEALYLFEFEGLSLADVAGLLEIETNAVKARLYRAREQLKLLLAHTKEIL